jgi:hypothetical protein
MVKTYLAWGLTFAFFSPILSAKPCGGFITQEIVRVLNKHQELLILAETLVR